ncbi:MAG: Tm-1-like ATP-binding domain-containing protein [Planctomycetes bacterium]|nr:Tm-1-like ATP-binding domain-containing protein [Planctomycetota bacterium]MBL7041215.1 Tm-1-like ATP-binding domain-containing protein [Pirellulaceae bacterium]
MSVYLLVTLDTKGDEAAFVRDRLQAMGVEVTVVDAGCIGQPSFAGDVTRDEVFQAAGTTLEAMIAKNDRGDAVTQAAVGAAKLVAGAFAAGQVDGVMSLGGSAGTTIGTTAMRTLPIGVPKLMVSTLASGQVRQYVGSKDIMMLNSVVDIAGINRISRRILAEAAAAMAGLVQNPIADSADDRPLVAATMFGVTTPCVQRARELLEEAGYEVLVFHATGNGGEAMESLVAEGMIAGVLDITTTELADELVGGILSAGPERLTAAARLGVPHVVSVGATDMVNFGPRDTVPDKFKDRLFYQHNPTVTLMRTTPEECAAIGKDIAKKVAASKGPAAIYLPRNGVSAIDAAGQPFDAPEAREALLDAIRQHHGSVELVELPNHINDPEFAEASARRLIEVIEPNQKPQTTKNEV